MGKISLRFASGVCVGDLRAGLSGVENDADGSLAEELESAEHRNPRSNRELSP